MPRKEPVVSLLDNPCNPDSRVMRIAETLYEAGHMMTVVCKFAEGLARDETVNGVRYVRVPMHATPFRPRSGVFKFRAYESFVREAVMALRPTILHANDLITLPAATHLARELGAKVVFDVHDLYLHGPKKRTGLAYWHGERVERSNIRRADRVITVSNGIADHLHRAYGIVRPTVVMNAPAVGTVSSGPGVRRLRDEIGVPVELPLAVYTGGRSLSRGLDRLVQAMADVEGLHVALVGHAQSADDHALKRIASDGGYADRLHLLPPVPHDLVVSYISSADFGVIPYHVDCLNHEYSMPHKLLEAVFAGLPVAVPDLQEVRQFVTSTQTGIVMNARDVAEIAKAMRTLVADRHNRRLGPERVSVIADEYGWTSQASRLLAVYDQVGSTKAVTRDESARPRTRSRRVSAL